MIQKIALFLCCVLLLTHSAPAQSRKATYPSLYGMEEARDAAAHAHRAACDALDRIDRPTTVLRDIVDLILNRTT